MLKFEGAWRFGTPMGFRMFVRTPSTSMKLSGAEPFSTRQASRRCGIVSARLHGVLRCIAPTKLFNSYETSIGTTLLR